jgi:hypothetical protein
MSESALFAQAMSAYLSNPNDPKNQSGTMNFGFNALIAAGTNPTQQFVGSFGYTITPNTTNLGGLNVTITNTTSFSSLMRFVTYFGLPIPSSWSRGDFPIMGNINQNIYIWVPCKQ